MVSPSSFNTDIKPLTPTLSDHSTISTSPNIFMATASEQVVDTVELLEWILLKLPTKDLLLSQRVAKQWQAVIKTSKILQEALFLRPIDGDDGPFWVEGDGEAAIDLTCASRRNTLISFTQRRAKYTAKLTKDSATWTVHS